MTVTRLLLRSLRRPSHLQTTTTTTVILKFSSQTTFLIPSRSSAFSSAEEAAAERRRLKFRLFIEPPIHALQRDTNAPRPRRYRIRDYTIPIDGQCYLHDRVQSLIEAGDLDNASVVACNSVFSCTPPSVYTCNAVIGSMCNAKRYSDAMALFTYFFKQCNIVPHVESYNFLIVSHCENGEVDKALDVYQYIKENAPSGPSRNTFRYLTKGLIDHGRIDEAVSLLRHSYDSHVLSNIILGFLNLGNFEKANEFFKSTRVCYDGIVHATFMEWFFSQGRPRDAMECCGSMFGKELKSPTTYNLILEVLLKWGKKAEAVGLFNRLFDSHLHWPPLYEVINSATLDLMVNECFKEGNESEAYGVFKRVGKVLSRNPVAMNSSVYNNIIMRYCEKDMMDDAEKMYVEMRSKYLWPDVNTFRALIDGYFRTGRIDEAMEKYTKMVDAGLRVIPTYANKWFSALIENGKIVECEPILSKMGERPESYPKPDATSYDIVIRALCATSNFDTGLSLLEQMVRYGVGVAPALKEHVLEVFDKVGRREEIDRVINARWSSYDAYVSTHGERILRLFGRSDGEEILRLFASQSFRDF